MKNVLIISLFLIGCTAGSNKMSTPIFSNSKITCGANSIDFSTQSVRLTFSEKTHKYCGEKLWVTPDNTEFLLMDSCSTQLVLINLCEEEVITFPAVDYSFENTWKVENQYFVEVKNKAVADFNVIYVLEVFQEDEVYENRLFLLDLTPEDMKKENELISLIL